MGAKIVDVRVQSKRLCLQNLIFIAVFLFMQHLPALIRDLGLILIIAGITTLLFKQLKQPMVLGYLLAGFLVSPNFALFPTISDFGDIKIWADIGVIFLLFNLGLEFSFKKLIHVGGTASVTAFIEVTAMLGIGFVLGKAMGWPLMDSIFLGGILSISSTTIILRAFDELGLKNRKFAGLVFGVLIIEDLVAVVLLVLLSTIAVSREFEGTEMLFSVLKLCFYLLLWFVAGIFFLPTFLRRAKKLLNDETMLILSIGLCLMMVILAAQVGFSPALGAFIMGSILAETLHAEHIEHMIRPVKDLFGAVFFVSVGMLIDPAVLVKFALPICIITIVFIFFKTLHVTLGALISGQSLKISLFAGMSQAQIGEFSFIIATLGLTLKVTSDFLYPIAVAVSAITTFTTTYMIKAAPSLYNWLNLRLPGRWRKALGRYSAGAQTITQASDWKLVLKGFLAHTVAFSLIIIGIILLFSIYGNPYLLKVIDNPILANLITALLCLVIITPFLWALVMRKFQPEAFNNLWQNKRYRGPLLFLRLARGLLAALYMGLFMLSFFPLSIAFGGLVFLIIISVIFSKKIHKLYLRMERRFFYNFNDRERQQAADSLSELAPWDAHIGKLEVPLHSPVTGKTLQQIAAREQFGVNIAMIRRGEHFVISAPGRDERLYPGDKLFVIGTDEQSEYFKNYLQPENVEQNLPEHEEVALKKIIVTDASPFVGKNIRESGVRETTNGIVVGVERGRYRMLNPESSLIFENGDKVWIVGDKKKIEELLAMSH